MRSEGAKVPVDPGTLAPSPLRTVYAPFSRRDPLRRWLGPVAHRPDGGNARLGRGRQGA